MSLGLYKGESATGDVLDNVEEKEQYRVQGPSAGSGVGGLMISKIISGGQTGADQAGLFAARLLGIETGGFVPLGYMTEAGPAPWLKEYGLVETPYRDYQHRTILNVQHSDATVVFGRRSAGSNLTERICRESNKPCLWVWLNADVWDGPLFQDMVFQLQPKVLNVAGNRESKWPGIEGRVVEFLLENLP